MSTASVLLIENEAVTALDLRELFEDEAYTVVGIASTTADVLDLLCSCQPGLALVDIHFADRLDGITVAAEPS